MLSPGRACWCVGCFFSQVAGALKSVKVLSVCAGLRSTIALTSSHDLFEWGNAGTIVEPELREARDQQLDPRVPETYLQAVDDLLPRYVRPKVWVGVGGCGAVWACMLGWDSLCACDSKFALFLPLLFYLLAAPRRAVPVTSASLGGNGAILLPTLLHPRFVQCVLRSGV